MIATERAAFKFFSNAIFASVVAGSGVLSVGYTIYNCKKKDSIVKKIDDPDEQLSRDIKR